MSLPIRPLHLTLTRVGRRNATTPAQLVPSADGSFRLVSGNAALDSGTPMDGDAAGQGATSTVDAQILEQAALEASLLDFDPQEEIDALVPMPRTIPKPMRDALTRTFARSFRHYAALDTWLHASHPGLGGDSPFERIVAGDGVAVLRVALQITRTPRRRINRARLMRMLR